jgi:hypothetical protein
MKRAGRLKEAYVHIVDKDYEDQQYEYLLEMADTELAANGHQAF